jgi:hypothetical protein
MSSDPNFAYVWKPDLLRTFQLQVNGRGLAPLPKMIELVEIAK